MQNLRVAHAYDRNRYHPPEVSGRIATAISDPLERAFKEAHVLEVGVGTGRIGMPVVARGFRFTGLDTDVEMMELFRAKVSGVSHKVSFVEGDAQDLPFEPDSFHGLIAVHVWHLVPDLELALNEAVRVLRPGGFLFEGWDAPDPDSPALEIQDAWCEAVKHLGYTIHRGAHRAALETSKKFLKRRKLQSVEADIAHWEVTNTPSEIVEALSEGLYSFTRGVPLEVRFQAAREIKGFLASRFPNIETPLKTSWSFQLRTTKIP
jgi:ubiquinone/menaquinone biosynthesis C-methylase UbiE